MSEMFKMKISPIPVTHNSYYWKSEFLIFVEEVEKASNFKV